jgi:hypothetical protein
MKDTIDTTHSFYRSTPESRARCALLAQALLDAHKGFDCSPVAVVTSRGFVVLENSAAKSIALAISMHKAAIALMDAAMMALGDEG